MLAAVQPAPGSLIVDVGCSQGLYARELAQAGAEVIAVDYSQAFLRSAVRRAASANVSIAPTRSLAQHLPLADASVDAAVSGGTLNDCGDPPAVVDELARVVRPGGCLFSMSLIGSHKRFGRTVMAVLGRSGIWFPDAVTTRALFESSGWIVRSERLDGLVLRLVLQRP